MEYLQDKLKAMDAAMKKDRETNEKHQLTQSNSAAKNDRESIGRNLAGITEAIGQLGQQGSLKLTELQIESNEVLYKHLSWIVHEQMRKEIQPLKSTENLNRFKKSSDLDLRMISFRSCKENPSKRAGKYIIQPTIN
uniref:Uncharacterized protein n=1 Tax=Anopheles christyi TaxID=43041 RepID=A0A182JSR0_9DIPT